MSRARRAALGLGASLGVLLGVGVIMAWWWLFSPSAAALAELQAFLAERPGLLPPGRGVFLIDLARPSYLPRGYLLRPETGEVLAVMHVAHGKESGWAWVERVSNQEGSHQSSIGAFAAAEIYAGSHGPTLRLHGLEPGVNDDALARAIVLHSADYVSWGSIRDNGGRLGRSLGCPAVPHAERDRLLDALHDGGLVYARWLPPR